MEERPNYIDSRMELFWNQWLRKSSNFFPHTAVSLEIKIPGRSENSFRVEKVEKRSYNLAKRLLRPPQAAEKR